MKEDELSELLRDAWREPGESRIPGFEQTWSAAEARHRRSRQRLMALGGVAAAAAVLAVIVGIWPGAQVDNNDEFMIASSLLNSTRWQAPSDALLPDYRDDIYGEIPALMESTGINEGPML